jgi:hypothetical protein
MTWGEGILVVFRYLYDRDLRKEAQACKTKNYTCIFKKPFSIGDREINLHTMWNDVNIDYLSYIDKQQFDLFLTYLELRIS